MTPLIRLPASPRRVLPTLAIALLAPIAFAVPVAGMTASAPSRTAAAAPPFYATPFERKPDAQTLTALGRALFFDRALSASGQAACATCHDPAHAFGPANRRAVQLGGATRALPGLRAVPSLMYRQNTPAFSEHFSDNDGDDSADLGPTGGLDWDGRAGSAHEQAAGPLLSPFEMANADSGAVVAKLKASSSGRRMREAFGDHVFDDPRVAWNGLVLALEVFQQSPADFYPYSSKYDAFLRGKVPLSAAEARGLRVFDDPNKGNCAVCHPSAVKRGAFPQFTDQGFIATGAPRNPAIPANADPAWNDLGLCGPLRTDLRDHDAYCGLFKTPSLRNVALRSAFFHNGVFSRLAEAVRFYALRDTDPQRFYPRDANGQVRKFDDLPARFRKNVNMETPFGRKPGDRAAFSEAEIADVVAFLKTLTDGYAVPAGPRVAAGRRP